MQKFFYFIGVTTTNSSIMRIFPEWMHTLGHPHVAIKGVDLQLNDEPANYRRVVQKIKRDADILGALVTTHKIDLLDAARAEFDFLDPHAQICGEVSCISKDEGQLAGHATDPTSGGMALQRIIEPGYFGKTGGHLLCLGAGGSGAATVVNMLSQSQIDDVPQRFILVDQAQARLDRVQKIIDQRQTSFQFELALHDDPRQNDLLLESLPPHSLIINATGMGKDRPGSPLTDGASFPQYGIAWEFNYRGERQFMQQAMAQQQSKELTVVDGWEYFLVGWIRVIEQVLHISVDEEMFQTLSSIAAKFR